MEKKTQTNKANNYTTAKIDEGDLIGILADGVAGLNDLSYVLLSCLLYITTVFVEQSGVFFNFIFWGVV